MFKCEDVQPGDSILLSYTHNYKYFEKVVEKIELINSNGREYYCIDNHPYHMIYTDNPTNNEEPHRKCLGIEKIFSYQKLKDNFDNFKVGKYIISMDNAWCAFKPEGNIIEILGIHKSKVNENAYLIEYKDYTSNFLQVKYIYGNFVFSSNSTSYILEFIEE